MSYRDLLTEYSACSTPLARGWYHRRVSVLKCAYFGASAGCMISPHPFHDEDSSSYSVATPPNTTALYVVQPTPITVSIDFSSLITS